MAEIFVLGGGTPTPTAARFGSSHVIRVVGDLLMFDCGPAATYKLVRAGLFPTEVDYLFFSVALQGLLRWPKRRASRS